MKERLANWCRPFGIFQIAFIFVMWFSAMLFGASTAFGWIPPLWTDLSSVPREMSLLPGVISSALAAGIASSVGPTSILGNLNHGRAGRTVARHLTRLIGVAFLGTTCAYLPALITGIVRATAGHPDILAIVGGYLVVAMWICLGYACGSIVKQPWATVLSLFISACIWVIPQIVSGGISLYSIAPVWSLGWPYLGFQLVQMTSIFRIVFFGGVSMSLVALAVLWLTRSKEATLSQSLLALSTLVPVLIVAVIALLQQPALVEMEPEPSIACNESTVARICVHEALSGMLPTAQETVEAISRPIPIPDLLRINDVSVPGGYMDSELGSREDADIWIRSETRTRDSLVKQYASEVAYYYSGWENCSPTLENPSASGNIWAAETLANALTYRAELPFRSRMTEGTGVLEPLFGNLVELSDTEFHRWFSERSDEIVACTLTDSGGL